MAADPKSVLRAKETVAEAEDDETIKGDDETIRGDDEDKSLWWSLQRKLNLCYTDGQ